MFPEDEEYKQPVDVPTPTSERIHLDLPLSTRASEDENSCALCCRFYVSEPERARKKNH